MNAEQLPDVVAGMADLTTLRSLLAATELDRLLRGPGPYTLFAPTDTAFARLPTELLTLLRADLPRLRAVLGDHLVSGMLVAADLMGLQVVTALSGMRLTLFSASGLRVEQSYLLAADHLAGNGVLHTVDGVLLLR